MPPRKMDLEYVSVLVGKTQQVIVRKQNPMVIGDPNTRKRLLAVCISRSSMVWVGPETEMVDEHFQRVVGRTCSLAASVFLCAD